MLRLQVENSENSSYWWLSVSKNVNGLIQIQNQWFQAIFCRIAYRDLCSQMHALCRRHTFNHCIEPPRLNSRVRFTCGFSHSQGRYDAWNSRITTGLWQIPRPKYTLAKSWKTVSYHECKVWLPHGRLKASLGHTELKRPSLSVDIWMSGCLKENRDFSIQHGHEMNEWRHAGSWVSLIPWSTNGYGYDRQLWPQHIGYVIQVHHAGTFSQPEVSVFIGTRLTKGPCAPAMN